MSFLTPKAKDIVALSEKKADPERAALEECARIAKKARNNVWDGPPALRRRTFTDYLLLK